MSDTKSLPAGLVWAADPVLTPASADPRDEVDLDRVLAGLRQLPSEEDDQ